MPPPQVGSVIQVQLIGSGNNQNTITNLHYWTVAVWQTAVDELMFYDQLFNIIKKDGANDVVTALTACCSTQWGIWKIRIQEIFPVRKFYKDYPVSNLGTNPGELQHQNICGVITKRTMFGGRRYVGRWRLPGVPDGTVVSGVFTVPQQNAMQNCGTIWKNQIINPNGEGHLEAVLYHPKAINQSSYDQIIAVEAQTDARTQRTRNIGKGF